jgi:hypothetical protein
LNQIEKLADQQQNLPGRAVVVWLGPGWPLLNDPRFLPDTAQIQARYFDHVVGLSTELRAAAGPHHANSERLLRRTIEKASTY